MNNRDKSILEHIIEYCDRLMVYTKNMDYEHFTGSDIHKDACAMCILQIGELVLNLTDEFKESHTKVPWKQIRSMRNIIAHHYGVVDAETVWTAIADDIPELRDYCQAILKESV